MGPRAAAKPHRVAEIRPAKVKAEFRRLNLELTFHPTEAEPRTHYVVKGQCALGALVFFYLRSRRPGAVVDPTSEGASGPQPHPSFIEVSCDAAFGSRYRKLEGKGKDAADRALS
jgi:hypothetical protein